MHLLSHSRLLTSGHTHSLSSAAPPSQPPPIEPNSTHLMRVIIQVVQLELAVGVLQGRWGKPGGGGARSAAAAPAQQRRRQLSSGGDHPFVAASNSNMQYTTTRPCELLEDGSKDAGKVSHDTAKRMLPGWSSACHQATPTAPFP